MTIVQLKKHAAAGKWLLTEDGGHVWEVFTPPSGALPLLRRYSRRLKPASLPAQDEHKTPAIIALDWHMPSPEARRVIASLARPIHERFKKVTVLSWTPAPKSQDSEGRYLLPGGEEVTLRARAAVSPGDLIDVDIDWIWHRIRWQEKSQ